MLNIKFSDILRATLSIDAGNEGWIGISPNGENYHVVVPVDVQIAKGVMACNRPFDGTPFGGYSSWLYFRCPPAACNRNDFESIKQKALQNSVDLVAFGARFNIDILIDHNTEKSTEAETASKRFQQNTSSSNPIHCSRCDAQWHSLKSFLKDSHTHFEYFRAGRDDVMEGSFTFKHNCGSHIQVEAQRLTRRNTKHRSLLGSHACPGFCLYETSQKCCDADCEGAVLRRLAHRLRARKKRAG